MVQSDRAQGDSEVNDPEMPAPDVPGAVEPVVDLVNRGFQKIVNDPDDIEQLVAYGRYKTAKHEWVKNRRPTKEEADKYFETDLASK